QPPNVVSDIRPPVARGQSTDDIVERARTVAQLEHLRRGGIEPHDTLGDQQHMLLAHLVVLQSSADGQTGTRHTPGASGVESWVLPRSIASSCAHSISVLKRSAATAASCSSRVAQRATVRSSAYCASRGACT